MLGTSWQRGLVLGVAVVGWAAASAQSTNVTTHHYDSLRTGWNSTETLLTPTAVSGGNFQLQHAVTLDEQVDAQPLLVTNRTIPGQGIHNVVYVATENNTVYALDATSGAVLVSKNFGAAVPQSALPGKCNNNSALVGITGTPVIDTSAATLYVITYVYVGKTTPTYYLHALDLATLADKVPAVTISASATLTNGKTYDFTPVSSRQRAALLLANGNVYAAFTSFCDLDANTSRGWVLGWQAGTLTPLAANKLTNRLGTTPDSFFLTSIWMSGAGLAASAAGNIYFVSGNTDYDGTQYNHVTNVAESAVELSPDLSTIKSLFTPVGSTYGHAALDKSDEDFGSGGLMLLPPQSVSSTNLAVAAGKVGILYLLNADTLGNNATTVTGTALGQFSIGGCWCTPSYYMGDDGFGRVVSSGYKNVTIWKVAGGSKVHLVKESVSSAVVNGQAPGFFTSVSSNGTATPVIWAVGRPASNSSPQVTLYAFDDSGHQLFSGTAGTWPHTGGNSNIVPVVANGKVYVASYKSLEIFGLGTGAAVAPPAITINATATPLEDGQHEIYGTVQNIDGTMIMIVTRSDELVRVDAETAFALFQAAPPSVGHGILVRGTFDAAGVFQAQVLLHAHDNPAMWPPDR